MLDDLPDAALFSLPKENKDDWYENMRSFNMDYTFPQAWSKDNKKYLALRSKGFSVIYSKPGVQSGIDQVLRICVLEYEKHAVLQEALWCLA